MSGKKVGLLLVGVMMLACGGGIALIAGGGLYWMRHQEQQETAAYCLAARQQAREQWLTTVAIFEEQVAVQQRQLAEHHAALERATLIQDLTAIDRYEGLISAADNRIISLNLAIETAGEMQTALAAQPTDAIISKALLLGEIPRDDDIREVLAGPMTATLALQDRCL